MAKFTALALDDVDAAEGYAAPRDATGVRWSKKLSPDDYSVWLAVSELEDGGTITWGDRHGDDGVYVLSGALEVDGRVCPATGAVIVESGVAATATAIGPTQIAHYGPVDDDPPADGLYGAPDPTGHGVHVVGDQGWYVSGDRERVLARWFADATCPTCRIALFHVWRGEGNAKDIPHTHTQDELIYLVDGSIVMGSYTFGPGTCLAIPADLRYSVTSGPDGMAFLNYRRDVSVQRYGKVKPEELEGALARGGRLVGDLR